MTSIFSRYWRATLATCLLQLGAVALVCYQYDPANLFGDRTYEVAVARLLADGKNVANVSNYDERLLQKFYVQKLTQPKDVIVLGSSRAMNIGAGLFPGQSFFNNSVSGASIEDHFAILELYRNRGFTPRQVILGLDPWLLNRFNGQPRWKSLEDVFLKSLPEAARPKSVRHLSPSADGLNRYQQLVSLDYLKAALVVASRTDRDFYPTPATELDVNIRLADGTLAYNAEYRSRSQAKVAEIARQEASRVPVYSLDNYRELDREYASLLDLFVSQMEVQGIQTLLFLPPYHPEMYDALTRDGSPYRIIREAENHFRALAKRKGIPIVGSYNPALTPCAPVEFYDGMHPKPSCIDKIFSRMSKG